MKEIREESACEKAFEFDGGRHLVMIAACDESMGIGRSGVIPWDNPEDRAYFASQTMGHPLIMGRRTYESLPTGSLLGRSCGVLTHQRDWASCGVHVSSDMHALLRWGFSLSRIVYCGGGGMVYRDMQGMATDVLLTRISGDLKCDVFFPTLGDSWKYVERRNFDTFYVELWQNIRKSKK